MKKNVNKKLSIALIALLYLSQPVFGQTVIGVRDCGQWVKESKSNISLKTWLIGFMSGLSEMHKFNRNKDDPLSKINSNEQIYLWVDNYCQKNPLEEIDSAGAALFIELMKK